MLDLRSEPSTADVEQLLTVRQLAKLVSLTELTVRQLIRREGLPVYRLGPRSTRLKYSEVLEWLRERDEGGRQVAAFGGDL